MFTQAISLKSETKQAFEHLHFFCFVSLCDERNFRRCVVSSFCLWFQLTSTVHVRTKIYILPALQQSSCRGHSCRICSPVPTTDLSVTDRTKPLQVYGCHCLCVKGNTTVLFFWCVHYSFKFYLFCCRCNISDTVSLFPFST